MQVPGCRNLTQVLACFFHKNWQPRPKKFFWGTYWTYLGVSSKNAKWKFRKSFALFFAAKKVSFFPLYPCELSQNSVAAKATFWFFGVKILLSFPCSAQVGYATNSPSAASSSVEWIALTDATPCKCEKSWDCLRFLLGLPSVWDRATILRIHQSHLCNFCYHFHTPILAPCCNSSHTTKAIAIECGVTSSLNATW